MYMPLINAKPIIDGKCWILEQNGQKIGTLRKEKKIYSVDKQGVTMEVGTLDQVVEQLGVQFEQYTQTKTVTKTTQYSVYDYPCSSKPYGPLYNVVKKLPIYAKSTKSKSQYCAGYYVIQFRKGWVKSFCPKLITLERYPFKGPFKTELEMRTMLNSVGKQNDVS
jgi:hypothetical protein